MVKEGLNLKQQKKDPSKNTYKEENPLPLESIYVGCAAKIRQIYLTLFKSLNLKILLLIFLYMYSFDIWNLQVTLTSNIQVVINNTLVLLVLIIEIEKW